MSKKKVLITGSCGFIFGNLIRKAIYEKQPYHFVSVDRVSSNAINSMYWNKNHIFHVADIRDQHVIDVIFQFEKPDIVIHGAAETFVNSSINNSNSLITSNVLGTQVILNSCLKYEVEKLIYISTDEVYGQLGDELAPPYDEATTLNPRNLYSATKAAGELLVRSASQSHGLIYNIIRSSNNYGPRQTLEKLIPKTIKCILNENKILIHDQGLQTKDWMHVFDNCSAILTILNKGEPDQIYNISANQEFSDLEVVQRICNYMGRGHNLINFVKNSEESHDSIYNINIDKIKKLGWEPKIKFKDGLGEHCILWYLNNQWWFK